MKNNLPKTDNNSLRKSRWPAFLHRRSMIWVAVAVVIMLLNSILPSGIIDAWYYRGLFIVIRNVYDGILGWIPIPMFYIILLLTVMLIVKWFNDRKGILYMMSGLVGGIALIIVAFYVLWGFNYRQYRLQDRLGFMLDEVSSIDVAAEFKRATKDLQNEAMTLQGELKTDKAIHDNPVTDRDLRPDVESVLQKLQLPHSGKVRVRELWPKGLLLRWSTAGIYIPHAFEGHIDPGLLSVQKPFTMAHEMAHGYGLTDEGACNFIAWLACRQSEDPWVRFSGALTYWRYAAAEMKAEDVAQALDNLDPVVRRCLLLIRENDKKYPDLMPKIRDAIYSRYLEGHGVEGGLHSYNYVVKMVIKYLENEPQ